MPDSAKIRKIAKIITNYSIALKSGEKVLLMGYGFESYPLIKEIYRECVRAGAQKIEVKFTSSELNRIFHAEATDKQLKYLDPIDKKWAATFDAMVQIVADENPYETGSIDPTKLITSRKAKKPISDILHKARWCLFYYPNNAAAQTAKKPLEEWEDFVFDSCIKDWEAEEKIQNKFINLMKKVKKIRITGEDTDLSLSVANQKWKSCCGKCNLPDGEIFTSPVLKSVSGHIRYNVPTRYLGHDFDWVKLTLKDGKVIAEESNNTSGALTQILETDKGARYYGEFAFGLNNSVKEASRMILYDEKMGKSLHMALGKCYDECPNGNDSSIHWDLIFNFKWAKATIFFDDKIVFQKNKWIDRKFDFLN